MVKNMGNTDRILRLSFVAIVVILYFLKVLSEPLAITLGAVSFILLATSLINFCPLYKIMGISTLKKAEEK